MELSQPGLLRKLDRSELSDGTLQYLLLVAALLTPRPAALMVLNEPETSLHPDLLSVLARLIIRASERGQVSVVSHDRQLIGVIKANAACASIELEKNLGRTVVRGQGPLHEPSWHWPARG